MPDFDIPGAGSSAAHNADPIETQSALSESSGSEWEHQLYGEAHGGFETIPLRTLAQHAPSQVAHEAVRGSPPSDRASGLTGPEIMVTQHDLEPEPSHLPIPPSIVISSPEDHSAFPQVNTLPSSPARNQPEYHRHYAAQSVAYDVAARALGIRNNVSVNSKTGDHALNKAVMKTRTEDFPLGRGNVEPDVFSSHGNSYAGAKSAQDFWPNTAFGRQVIENNPEDAIAFRAASARFESAGVCYDHGVQTALNLSSLVPHSDNISMLMDHEHDHVSVAHQGRIGDAWAEGPVVDREGSMAHEHRDHIENLTLDAGTWNQIHKRSEQIESQLAEQLSLPDVHEAHVDFLNSAKSKITPIMEGHGRSAQLSIYTKAPPVLSTTFQDRIVNQISQIPKDELDHRVGNAIAHEAAASTTEHLSEHDVLVELHRLATEKS